MVLTQMRINKLATNLLILLLPLASLAAEITENPMRINCLMNECFRDELLSKTEIDDGVDGYVQRVNSQRYHKDVFFKVVDVASNDVLNIRSQPTSKSEIVGSFAYNEPLVEVTGKVGRWFRVNVGERSGWVYSRYLQSISFDLIRNTNLPEGLRCFGEEPFWTVRIRGNRIHLSHQNHSDQIYYLTNTQSSESSSLISGANSKRQIQIFVRDEIATSSMVDRYYNWSVSMLIDSHEVPGATGCSL